MGLDRTNQWLTLAANVGVLAGILLLAHEIQQNTVATQSAAASSLQSTYADFELLIAADGDFAEILRKGRDGESLGPTELLRLIAFYRTVLRGWQNAHFQYLSGGLDRQLWSGECGLIVVTLPGFPTMQNYWRSNQALYSASFNAFMDRVASGSERCGR